MLTQKEKYSNTIEDLMYEIEEAEDGLYELVNGAIIILKNAIEKEKELSDKEINCITEAYKVINILKQDEEKYNIYIVR